MFSPLFPAYVESHDGAATIGTIDDFICQECTIWSGLGVIDILAGVLDVPEADRQTLRGWYERHAPRSACSLCNRKVRKRKRMAYLDEVQDQVRD